MSNNPRFVMSKFASSKALAEAKVNYFETRFEFLNDMDLSPVTDEEFRNITRSILVNLHEEGILPLSRQVDTQSKENNVQKTNECLEKASAYDRWMDRRWRNPD